VVAKLPYLLKGSLNVMQVIHDYGFENSQSGAMAFSTELQKHKDDPEVPLLASRLAYSMPILGKEYHSFAIRIQNLDLDVYTRMFGTVHLKFS
jgi:hypothetical protein